MMFFKKCFSSALSYTSQSYAEAMAIHPNAFYTPYSSSSKEQTEDIITFAQFEEGGLLSETCNDTESGSESDDNSNLAPLVSEEVTDYTSSGDSSYT